MRKHKIATTDNLFPMLPAGALMIEHRLIERMITVMSRHKAGIDGGMDPDPSFLMTAIDFLRSYADHGHHGKEEELLFKQLATKPLPPEMREAMDRLTEDHVRSRSLVRRLEELTEQWSAGDRSVRGELCDIIGDIVTVYPDHIAREDKEFFPRAMRLLDPQERDEMVSAFKEFDRKLFHERYLKVVEGVERK